MDPQNEKELVQRAKTDSDAFGEIFDIYYDRVLAYALKRTGDAQIATDIAAEVFAKALKNIRWFTWRGIPLSAWLFRIAGNEVRMFYRRQKYLPASLDRLMESGYDPDDAALSQEISALDAFANSQDEKRLLEALSTLSRPEQDLIVLRYFEGLKTKEIAELLGKPEGTVRSLLSRTLIELRRAYANMQQKKNPSIIESEGRSGLQLRTNEL